MKWYSWMVLALTVAMGAWGCMDRKPAPVCPVPTELQSNDYVPASFDGVDIIVVVDNSGSMKEEQQILATSFFPLINSLVSPLPSWPFPPTENVRIAITSSDMGLATGPGPDNYYNNPNITGCGMNTSSVTQNPKGNNGQFYADYVVSPAQVTIAEGVIPCGDASQCPPGWTCGNVDAQTGVGTCMAGTAATTLDCPDPPSRLSKNFLEFGDYPDNLAFATACLAQLGIDGCGFEQQLGALAASMENDGQAFIRPDALTVLMVVSDEEDCTIKDPLAVYESQEFKSATTTVTAGDGQTYSNVATANIACGEHPEGVWTVSEIKARYEQAKARAVGGSSAGNSILFAAIVGVPMDSRCQGKGTELSECLDVPLTWGTMSDPKIQVVQRQAGNTVQNLAMYEYACERYDAANNPVTQAQPGTRYVQMAQEFGNMSYVYSICNADWSEAMQDIAKLIAQNISGTCYSKRLAWDASQRKAKCNAVYQYVGENACPTSIQWEAQSNVKSGDDTVSLCTLPKYPMPIDCADISAQDLQDVEAAAAGWYYCERRGRENYSGACADGKDNDGDGLVDCDDDECAACGNCAANNVGDVTQCPAACEYQVSFNKAALDEAKRAYNVSIQCLQEFKFEDPNCQENSYKVCHDGRDNDGNGPYDCDRVTYEQDPQNAHNPDPSCCPVVNNGGQCNFDLDGDGTPDWQETCPGDAPPAACYDAAEAVGCVF